MVIILTILGLVVGSFLGAYTYRYPRRIQIIKGRSFCPKCETKITWYDNLPLLSFALLNGKCRNCGKKISFRYPVIELMTALGFVGIWYFSLPSLLFIILPILMAVFVIDLEHKIIPDELVLGGFILIAFSLLMADNSSFLINLLSGFSAASFLLFLHLITKGRGMGLGDVKLALMIGTFLGWPKTLTWLLTAFLTGAMVGLILIIIKRFSFGKQIAFGPFLVVSVFLTLIWGRFLVL
jgi:leader peptidase (prepilin peptidase)/N-methyltransferase